MVDFGMTEAQRVTAARLVREGFVVSLQPPGYYLAVRGADRRQIKPNGTVGRADQAGLDGYGRAQNYGGRR